MQYGVNPFTNELSLNGQQFVKKNADQLITGNNNFTGQCIFGSSNLSYPLLNPIKDSSSVFQSSIGVTYLGQGGSNAVGINTLIDTSKIDCSKAQYNYYYGSGLVSKVVTSGIPSSGHKSSAYGGGVYCILDDTPATGSTDGPQSSYGLDCGTYTLNPRSMFSMAGINGYVGYYATSGSTGSDPQYAGIFGLSYYAQASGGSHQNLVGTDTAFTIYGTAAIANAYGVRNINEVDSPAGISNAYGLYSKYNNYSGQPTIAQNIYGMYLEDVSGLGSINSYAVYSNGGPSYFRDAISAGAYRLNRLQSAPASATDVGIPGEVRFCDGAIYLCVAQNTWQRAILTTF